MDDAQLYDLLRMLPRTGSGYFGLDNPADDDRYCDVPTFAAICDAVASLKLPSDRGSNFDSISFELLGTIFDVFSVSREELVPLQAASEVLKYLCSIPGYRQVMSVKKHRVTMFQYIRAMGSLPVAGMITTPNATPIVPAAPEPVAVAGQMPDEDPYANLPF